jgi:sterol desaturase/sphingolipid hydroxylase (fatty acid hydroxylase superfamily)
MSMHPVESTLYISRVLLPLLIPAHPLHFLFLLMNTTLMPIPGHSGHLELLGNEYHW